MANKVTVSTYIKKNMQEEIITNQKDLKKIFITTVRVPFTVKKILIKKKGEPPHTEVLETKDHLVVQLFKFGRCTSIPLKCLDLLSIAKKDSFKSLVDYVKQIEKNGKIIHEPDEDDETEEWRTYFIGKFYPNIPPMKQVTDIVIPKRCKNGK